MTRALACLLLVFLLAGCSWFRSGDTAAADAAGSVGEADKSRLCDDAAWKAAHLGLWYNVCTRGTVF